MSKVSALDCVDSTARQAQAISLLILLHKFSASVHLFSKVFLKTIPSNFKSVNRLIFTCELNLRKGI